MPSLSTPVSLARKTAEIERALYRSATNTYRRAEEEYYMLLRQSMADPRLRSFLPDASDTLKQAYRLEQLAYLRYRAARFAATEKAAEAEGRNIVRETCAVLS